MPKQSNLIGWIFTAAPNLLYNLHFTPAVPSHEPAFEPVNVSLSGIQIFIDTVSEMYLKRIYIMRWSIAWSIIISKSKQDTE